MSDKKLYQLSAKSSVGASDLIYLASADGSADGSAPLSGLTSTLGGLLDSRYAAASHTHAIADVTGLQAALDAKLATTAIGTTVQAYSANLTTFAGIAPSANVQTLLGAADYSAFRTSLSLVIGTNVQAYNANLTTFAAIAPSANVQTFLGAANYAAMKTQLALTIGTDVQAYNANLTTYAGIAPSANVQTLLGSANYAAFRSSLSVGAVGLLSTVTEADQTLADNTTNNVSTSKHGYAPKAPNDATKYLDGTGAYSVPAGSAGAMTKLGQTSWSSGSSIVVNSLSTSYTAWKIIIEGVMVGTDAVNLNLTLYVAGSEVTSGYKYWVRIVTTGATTNDSNSTSASLIALNSNSATGTIGNAAGKSFSATVTVYQPSDTANHKHVHWEGSYSLSTTNSAIITGAAVLENTSAVNGVKVAASSGNLTGGRVTVYGLST